MGTKNAKALSMIETVQGSENDEGICSVFPDPVLEAAKNIIAKYAVMATHTVSTLLASEEEDETSTPGSNLLAASGQTSHR
jgi:hypothetical protein